MELERGNKVHEVEEGETCIRVRVECHIFQQERGPSTSPYIAGMEGLQVVLGPTCQSTC